MGNILPEKTTSAYQIKPLMRNGVELEKGVSLSLEYVTRWRSKLEKTMAYFTAYPDMFLDMIKPQDSNFSLFFYQRIMLRALFRYTEIYIVAPRAAAKSFITILALILQCVFIPGTTRFICAPGKGQSAKIAKQKIFEIYERYPLLRKEVIGGDVSDTPGNFGNDYVTLKFKNGSIFDVTAPLDSTRGGRRHGGLIDEVRDHDEKPLNEIVLPLLNVSRRHPKGHVNPKEVNQQIVSMTSAGVKTSFAYSMLIDKLELSIINPKTTFVMGFDYRIPVMHGLLARDFVNKLKMSPSYSEESFAREYLSLWSGGSEESWFNFDKMVRYRKLKNPELYAKFLTNKGQFYLLSVDVGRIHDQTVCSVFRVNPRENKYYASLVNIVVLGLDSQGKTFANQAIDLKRLIKAYNPIEVVIDTNGLGVGLADLMVSEQYDLNGEFYPAYGFHNDAEYKKTQPASAPKILYSLKANGSLNSQIHSNVYSRVSSGLVRFLIKEQDARSALMETKAGQRLSPIERAKRLMPHEMTTRLFEEMGNLRLKQTGLDIVLERVNSRFPKDKYSSFAYGLWRIKELEDLLQKRVRRNRTTEDGNLRKLTFFTGGSSHGR